MNLDIVLVRIGVFWELFSKAEAHMVEANKQMLRSFESRGATIVEVSLPHMMTLQRAHTITITSEVLYWRECRRNEMGVGALPASYFIQPTSQLHIFIHTIRWRPRWIPSSRSTRASLHPTRRSTLPSHGIHWSGPPGRPKGMSSRQLQTC